MSPAGPQNERWIAGASAVLVAAALFPFTAKPTTWDELVYMGLAFRPEPQPGILDGYAHVYAMLPFMRIAGDAYVGARLFWCCAVGVTAGMLVYTALCEREAMRRMTTALTILFFAGRADVFDHPGIAYPEYSAMTLLTAAFCLLWTRLARGTELSDRDAAVLGLLTLLGMKARVAALLLIVALLFMTSSGLRLDRAALRRGASWLGGAAGGAVLIMGLDLIFLGDAWFSVRPSSWRGVSGYNFAPVPETGGEYQRLGWMVRPETLCLLVPYVIAGWFWLKRETDVRLRLLYVLPLVLFVMRASIAPRDTVPVAPMLCFLTAMALARLMSDGLQAVSVSERGDVVRAGFRWFAIALGVVAATAGAAQLVAWFAGMSADTVERGTATGLMMIACGMLLRWRGQARLITAMAVPAIAAAALLPAWRVGMALASRQEQRAGEARFAGFYEVARAVRVAPDAMIFVSNRLYDGGIRSSVLPALTRMNFNLRLEPRQMASGVEPSSSAAYAVVDVAQYRRWRTLHGVEPLDAVVSSDGRVALLCLRNACARVAAK